MPHLLAQQLIQYIWVRKSSVTDVCVSFCGCLMLIYTTLTDLRLWSTLPATWLSISICTAAAAMTAAIINVRVVTSAAAALAARTVGIPFLSAARIPQCTMHIPDIGTACSYPSYATVTRELSEPSGSTAAAGSTPSVPLQAYIPPWVAVLLPAAAAVQKSAQVWCLWGVGFLNEGLLLLRSD